MPIANLLEDIKFGAWSNGPEFPANGRAGQTLNVIKSDGAEGVVTVGGADGNGTHADSYIFKWESFTWSKLPSAGLSPRYEHCTFTRGESSDSNLMVFGGGHVSGCYNDVYENDGLGQWTEVVTRGSPPSPRTFHSSANAVRFRDNIFVFGGAGHSERGACETPDRRVHVLSLDTMTWSHPETFGTAPLARHGHAVVIADGVLYVHGGLAGQALFDDLHALDLASHHWSEIETGGDVPAARASHTMCSYAGHLIMYGGCAPPSKLEDISILNIERKIWSTVKLCGPALPTRLDHAMCIAEIPGPASSQTPAESAGAVETAAVCAGRGETDGQLMTILSADRKASGPVALSSLLPPLGNGKRLVLCVLGGVNMFASRPEDQMFKEFALLQITP